MAAGRPIPIVATMYLVAGRGEVQGGPGFILLATRVDAASGNDASGEELQDHACRVLTGAGAALERVR